MSSATKVTDESIVAGFGLAGYCDDSAMEEPSAASTAGQKSSRKDIISKQNTEYLNQLMPPPSSLSVKHSKQNNGCHNDVRLTESSKCPPNSFVPHATIDAHKTLDKMMSCVDLDDFSVAKNHGNLAHTFPDFNISPQKSLEQRLAEAKQGTSNHRNNELGIRNIPHIIVDADRTSPELLSSSAFKSSEGNDSSWLFSSKQKQTHAVPVSHQSSHPSSTPSHPDEDNQQSINLAMNFSEISSQGDLQQLIESEQFGEANFNEMEADEKRLEESKLVGLPVHSGEMTGICGEDEAEITVSKSWLGPQFSGREKVSSDGSKVKVKVGDYLKSGSMALGSLGGSGVTRPSFGFGQKLMSPPSANSTHFSTVSSPETTSSVSDCPFDQPTAGDKSDSPFKTKKNSLGLFGTNKKLQEDLVPSSATAPALGTRTRTRGDGLSLEASRPSSTSVSNYGSLDRSKHMRGKARVNENTVKDALNLEAKKTAVEEIKSLLDKVSSDDSPRTKITQLQDLLCGLTSYDRSELQEETMINQSLEINALKKRRQEIMYGQNYSAVMKKKLESTKSAPPINLIEEEYEECNVEDATLDDTIRMTPNVSYSKVLTDETKTENPFLSLCDMTMAMDITDTTQQESENRHLFVEGCVQSIATWFSIPIDNPTDNYIRVSARINSETLNGGPVQNSSLIFKEGYVIPPNQKVVWVAGVCGRELGTLVCVLSLTLVDMSSGDELITHTIPVKATINLPQVRIGQIDLKENVGIIPEISRHDSQLEIINDSDRELAVLISFTQHGNFFQFRESENTRFVSSSEVACVLKPGMNPLPYSIHPPQLDVDAESLDVSSTVSVKIDSPQLPRPCLATKEVYAKIVPIIVNIPRSCFPLNLPLVPSKITSVKFSLANLSCIPIDVVVTIKDSTAKNLDLQVVPSKLHLEANSVANPIIYCQLLDVNTPEPFNAVVVITLNGKGLTYTIPLIGKPTTLETLQLSSKEQISQSILNLKVPQPKKEYVHIQGTRSTLVFPAVQTNTTVSQRISFSNTNAYDVTLCPSISEFSSVFTADCQTLTISAKSSASFTVSFSPQQNKDYSTVLVCRTHGLHRKFKYSIALQGYGGCGVLNIEEKMLLFPNSSPGVPSIVRLPLSNTGSRAICVEVSHTGKQDSLTIPCTQLVIPAGEERRVVLMWCTKEHIGARDGQVHLGDLVVRYSEELLRKRYTKRLEEGCFKASSFSRGGSSWSGFFSGEELTTEKNILKSHADDSKVFFNSLRKLKVAMYCTLTDCTTDASITCFSPLLPDMTVSEDTTIQPESEYCPSNGNNTKQSAFVFPSVDSNFQGRVNRLVTSDDKENVTPQTPIRVGNSETLLEVLPQKVTLLTGGMAGIVAVNRSKQTQSFTVKCDEILLKATPMSGAISPSGSLGILLQHTGKSVTSPLVLRLVSSHQVTEVTVNVETEGSDAIKVAGNNCKIPQPVSEVPAEPTKKLTETKVSVGGLSVAHSSLSFPMTYVSRESCMKLSIRNPTPHVRQVLASISNGSSFIVKHPHFKINAGYFVNIPLFFKPRSKGDHKATLKLSVGDSDCMVLLTGTAVV